MIFIFFSILASCTCFKLASSAAQASSLQPSSRLGACKQLLLKTYCSSSSTSALSASSPLLALGLPHHSHATTCCHCFLLQPAATSRLTSLFPCDASSWFITLSSANTAVSSSFLGSKLLCPRPSLTARHSCCPHRHRRLPNLPSSSPYLLLLPSPRSVVGFLRFCHQSHRYYSHCCRRFQPLSSSQPHSLLISLGASIICSLHEVLTAHRVSLPSVYLVNFLLPFYSYVSQPLITLSLATSHSCNNLLASVTCFCPATRAASSSSVAVSISSRATASSRPVPPLRHLSPGSPLLTATPSSSSTLQLSASLARPHPHVQLLSLAVPAAA